MKEGLSFEKQPNLSELFLTLDNSEFRERLEELREGSNLVLRVDMSALDDVAFSMKAFALKGLLDHPPSHLGDIKITIVGTARQKTLNRVGNVITSGVAYEVVN